MTRTSRPANAASLTGIEALAAKLKFSFSAGSIWMGEERMTMLNMAAFSSLRKELVDSLGLQRARGVMTRMGFQAGQRDADYIRKQYPDLSRRELIPKGPMLHSLEGNVKAELVRLEFNEEDGSDFNCEVIWKNSFEGALHRELFGDAEGSLCWMQLGYATGYSSAIMNRFILFTEPECSADGCRIVGHELEAWDPQEAQHWICHYRPDAVADQILDLQEQVQNLRASIQQCDATPELIGNSPAFRAAWDMTRKAAASQITVLLMGETGVGKEVFARALHSASSRAAAPFVAVNCGALPEQLVESELFGVEQGAYTGAHRSRPGRFERANGGTIFLDEIGELPLAAQAKLLRVLQEGEVERVGDSVTRKVNVRVVAATNVDLVEAMRAGTFRKDLYYRLSSFPVMIPPLRERRSDIPLLVNGFIERFATRDGKRIKGLTDKAMQALMDYAWPGNVRELQNMTERGVLMAANDARIDVGDLFVMPPPEDANSVQVSPEGMLCNAPDMQLQSLVAHAIEKRIGIDEIERLLLDAAMRKADGNVSEAARVLGLSRSQLRYRLNQPGADD